MSSKLFLAIGEPMVELSGAGTGDADLWRMGFAGDVLNTLWYTRAALPADGAGGWRTALLTRLGSDPFSSKLRGFLTHNGIDTAFVQTDEQRGVGLYAISLSENGERSFSYWRSHSAARRLADDRKALSGAIAAADVVYFSGITMAILPDEGRQNLLEEIGAAQGRGQRIVFDPNIRRRLWDDVETMKHWLTQAMAVASIGLPSFDDEADLWGDTTLDNCLSRWQEAGCGEVVVKNGGGDMIAAETGQPVERLTVERQKPVDTTGAGDAFNAGYIAARLDGRSTRQAMLDGHAMASRVIAVPGALMPMTQLR
ncbi:sugar kinase [Rhizobium sp. EC-SD404]|uniref:sugar kinase n=1 Tax=Rhizobium sp. EC-SD404 TaxID=2038389 RepID=UPI0012527991|nr:sugar kinase [Rhizobium sp. EC-SD404]VVS98901.1 2-keto-3-deoxygluconate kinase [Rhizobium sp. EC-SD404]